MKYAPVAYQGVESTLGMLKDSLAKEDYKSVLAGTPKLTEAVTSLKNAIASGKQQFEAASAEWTALSADVPQMVAAIQSRVDTLGSSRKLPKNVSRESFDGAKSGLDSMKSMWNEASAAATDGKPGEAAEKARAVKAKGQEVLTMLGMTGA
jgi:chromosome segregation ATPase